MRKEDVYLHCLERWSSADKRISYFEENFDEWFSQLPEDIHEVVCKLLEMFEYYSQLKVNQYLCDLGFKLDEKEQFNPDATIYTPLPSHKGIANSSYDYLFTYRQLHDVSKYKIALDLDRYIEEKPDKYVKIQNIVIIDDYCGSGESLKTFIENHSEQLRGKTIYYLVTYFMQEAMPLIDETSRQHEVTIEVIYINSGKRAFEYNAFSERKDELRPLIKRRSKKLNIPKKYCLGKYESESLVSFYNDTPNNTFGLFWYDSDKYFSIFPREFENTEGLKRPTPRSLKQQKAARTAQNYLSATRRAQNE